MEYFDGFDDLEEVKESDFVREFGDFYDNRKDAKSENEEDKIDNNDIALVRRNGNVNMCENSDITDPDSDDDKNFKKQYYNNKNFSSAQKKTPTFNVLFEIYTVECERDGNCFIWSASNILGYKITRENMMQLRTKLQEVYNKICNELFNNSKYKEEYRSRFNKDYKGLETNKEWVEIEPGVVSLAKYMEKPFAVLSRSAGKDKDHKLKSTFDFFIANENGELKLDCSLSDLKKEIIENKVSAMVLNVNHYQALKNDPDSRNNFLNDFFEFLIDQRCEDIKQSIKETTETKEKALLDAMPILLSGSENADLLCAKVLSARYSTIDTTEKEKILLGIVEEVRTEAKKFNIDEDYLNIKECSEVFDHADKNNDLSSVLDFDIIRDNRISNYKDKKNEEEENRIPKEFMCKKKKTR